ncbi:hypothetical protein DMN91_006877 [Ooceraea biroi]|uniref:Uncharacterized protein n=1 Tax=Ooceraea biroi TaxID=2015173 RepID=A0A026WGM6_OOCBI|nr:uncharacterized protein LOC105279898 [Ooceraea biroi]XP_019887347.1 uncharacterized protein LOC105279898 [Ooceraea biroi]EZA54846.1 hypothetical protein X777_05132 [Ooceraea biroi]RLU20270.1 hypothetical protein DMN91_006877 [Ooceraea biroi]
MEREDKHQENTAADESQPFSKENDFIALLKTIFRRGYPDLPSDILPGKSAEERQFAIKLLHEQAKRVLEIKPTLVNWLQSGLFVDEEFNVPLALLLIEWYEQHPTPYQENGECNFREIYHFIYKMVMNQPVPYLSHNSAKVLHTLLSEVIDEVWPSSQDDVMDYLNHTYSYSRPGLRRTYSRKK